MTIAEIEAFWKEFYFWAGWTLLLVYVIMELRKPRVVIEEEKIHVKYFRNLQPTGNIRYKCYYFEGVVLVIRHYYKDGRRANVYYLRRLTRKRLYKKIATRLKKDKQNAKVL